MTLPIMRESKNCKWLVFMAISLVTYLKTVVPSLYKYRLPASSFCQKGAILKEDSSLLCRWIWKLPLPKAAFGASLSVTLWMSIESSLLLRQDKDLLQKLQNKCQNLLLSSAITITIFEYVVSSILLGALHSWLHSIISTTVWGLVLSTLLMKERRLVEARQLVT